MTDLNTIKKLIDEERYDELSHTLYHEDVSPSEIKKVISLIRESKYKQRLIEVKIAILSSYTIQNINDPLEMELIRKGFLPIIKYGQYNQFTQEMLDENSFLYSFKPDFVIIALDTQTFLENISLNFLEFTESQADSLVKSKLEYLKSAITVLNKKLKTKVLITNLEIPTYSPHGIRDANMSKGSRYIVSDFNFRLHEETKALKNVFIIDFERLASYIGKKNITDKKYYYIGKIYLGKAILPLLSSEIGKIISSSYGKVKKCLVVDLDNTLWGGVVGEDGPLGIKIGNENTGSVYKEVQKIILNLYRSGILIAINSRNNVEDVMSVFEKNSNMVLKKEHFSKIKINWNDKAENIKEIAKELNIGIDSIAFLDDNPLERGIVKKKLPGVYVIDFPEDISELPEVLKHLHCFEFMEITEEDKKRNEMYLAESKRFELQKNFDNVTDYFFDLGSSILVKENSVEDLERITQLINKTNQFNL
jgi:HAD superfamily phosphatase (TIGR01681 family)